MELCKSFLSEIEIRRADLADIKDIIVLNRASFPDSLKERAPFYYLKKWWVFLLSSASTEVYVITNDKILIGFAVLIISEDTYKKESKLHQLPWHCFIYGLLTSPELLLYLPQKVLSRLRTQRAYNQDTSNKRGLEERTWIELAALSKEYQGKGLAKRLFSFLEQRTKDLDRNTICSLLNKTNHAVIFLHESLGYSKTHETAAQYYYKKRLL
jgi:ribosomal protein S18 acetylase RimI-like enzyme